MKPLPVLWSNIICSLSKSNICVISQAFLPIKWRKCYHAIEYKMLIYLLIDFTAVHVINVSLLKKLSFASPSQCWDHWCTWFLWWLGWTQASRNTRQTHYQFYILRKAILLVETLLSFYNCLGFYIMKGLLHLKIIKPLKHFSTTFII